MGEYSDNELLSQFRDENTRSYAFYRIVQEYQEKMYWFIRRMVINHDDANDLVQDVFIKAWEGLDNFRGDCSLSSWLYKIAHNTTITFLNKKRKMFFIPIVDVEKKLTRTLKSDSSFEGDEIQLKLQKAILSLPEKQRVVFNMKYYDNMKYEQMSEVLGTSVGALKASFHHAVKKIEEFIRNLAD